MRAAGYISLAAACVAMLMFTACKKSEGVYASKKKIACIYTAKEGWYTNLDPNDSTFSKKYYQTSKYKSENWEWEKRKPSRITYYNPDGIKSGEEQFTYKSGKVVMKTDRTNSSKAEFTYNDKMLESVHWYVDGAVYAISKFTHDGKQMREIKTSVFSMNTGKSGCCPLLSKAYDRKNKADAAGIVYSERLVITWETDNISHIECYDDDSETPIATWTFTYDTKSNPLRNFWTKREYYGSILPHLGSMNNLLNEKIVTRDGKEYNYTYQYKYDGDYPTECVRSHNEGEEGNYPRQEVVTMTYNYE